MFESVSLPIIGRRSGIALLLPMADVSTLKNHNQDEERGTCYLNSHNISYSRIHGLATVLDQCSLLKECSA